MVQVNKYLAMELDFIIKLALTFLLRQALLEYF